LAEIYGNERVIDTPLAESGIIGTALGMAVAGLKPVAEIQFEGFFLPGFDQVVSHVSRIRNRSRGRFTAPLVIRCPIGGGIKALEHHSDSIETYFIHTSGLKVVTTPASTFPINSAVRSRMLTASRSVKRNDTNSDEGQLTVDVYQTDSEIVIKSTIAGVKSDSLDISITNDILTIKGKREKDEEVKPENYYYQELYWGPFSRSIILPVDVESEKMST